MLTLLALLAQSAPPSPPLAMAALEQDLQGWFDERYAPSVRAAWSAAEPVAKIAPVSDLWWGPDADSHPRPCGAFALDPAEDGLTRDQIHAARKPMPGVTCQVSGWYDFYFSNSICFTTILPVYGLPLMARRVPQRTRRINA